MPKAKTVDDINEPVANSPELLVIPIILIPELRSLVDSDIITFDGANIVWRTGHLESIAREFAADPMRCANVHHDDLTVALAHSREVFEALVEAANGEVT